jgi:hypothetical protein
MSAPISEAELGQLWAGQRFPASALVTAAGAPLRVIHPGWPGRGAGPDFRDAIVAAPAGPLLRGDIELHLRASDFRAHGHDRDRRYDRLVLHVVYEDDAGGETALAGGRRVPVVALERWARGRADELARWLAAPRLWREPCYDAAARLGREHLLRALEELGDARFADRAGALADAIAVRGAPAALYGALLEGVCYGGERALAAFVAARLPWAALSARLGGCREGEAAAAAEEALLAAADGAASGAGRPANRPARRLAGLARLLARHRPLFDGAGLEDAVVAAPAGLVAAWGAPPDIGRGRAIELLVNAVLPWCAALGDEALAARARAAFARLPRPASYGALRFLEENLALRGALDARRQQGLLALYKHECTDGGCGRCLLS